MARGDDLVLAVSADTAAFAAGLSPMTKALDALEHDAADADKAVSKLSGLDAAPDTAGLTKAIGQLDRLADEAEQAGDAVRELDGTQVEITVQEQAIRRARDRIDELRDKIAEDVILGVSTKAAEQEITRLQSTVRKLTTEPNKVTVDVEMDAEPLERGVSGVEALREGVNETTQSLGNLGQGFSGVTGLAMAMVPALADLNETLVDMRAQNEAAGKSMGRLGKATQAVTGVMAGPWGLAIAAGVGLLSLWAESEDDAAEATDKFSDSIDVQAGAIDRANRQTAAKKLQDQGILEMAKAIGLSTEDVVSSVLGERDAYERVNGALGTYLTGLQANKAASPTWVAMVEDTSHKLSVLQLETLGAAEASDVMVEAVGGLADASQLAADAMADQAQAMGDQRRMWSQYTEAIGEAQSELDKLIGSLDLYNGRTATAAEATATYEADLDDMNATLKETGKTTRDHGKSLDLSTEAGRKNQDMLLGLAKDVAELSEARLADMQTSGETSAQIMADYEQQRDSLVKTAVRMGLTEEAARRYVDQVLKAPDDIDTKVVLTGVDKVDAQLDALSRDRQMQIEVDLDMEALRRRGLTAAQARAMIGATSLPQAPAPVPTPHAAPPVFLQPRLYLDSAPIRAVLRADVTTAATEAAAATRTRGRL
jgi:hypothetical protein